MLICQELHNVLIKAFRGLSSAVQPASAGVSNLIIKRTILAHLLSNNIHLGLGGIKLPI